MTTELKPCPFCGCAPGIGLQVFDTASYKTFVVGCCVDMDSGSTDINDAIAMWNERVQPWVKVEERLPEAQPGKFFSRAVLVVNMASHWPHVRMSELNYDTDGSSVWSGGEVTHWMETPTLPLM